MRLSRLPWLLPLLIFPLTALLLAFSSGPLPGLTGGFQEQTCNRCHSSFALDEGRTLGGTFHLVGVPPTYHRGVSYPITVVIGQPGQSRWGFELSTRFSASAGQAGQLVPVDPMTQVKEDGGIQYIEHTSTGNREGTVDGPVAFQFQWIAPDPSGGPVFFNAAGNAADSSGDPLGDYIYTAGAYSGASQVAAPPAVKAEKKPFRRLNTAHRFLHLPAPKDTQRGSVQFHVQHRFLEPLGDSRPGRGFGIDSGANINLELDYSPTDRLNVGVSRARFTVADSLFAPAIIAFTGTYEIQTDEDSLWKMSLLGGVEGQESFTRHYSPFLQLATSLDYGRLRTYLVPTVIFNSRRDESLQSMRSIATNPEDNHTFSLGLGLDVAATPRFSLSGEYVPRLAGFGGFGSKHPSVAAGVKIRT